MMIASLFRFTITYFNKNKWQGTVHSLHMQIMQRQRQRQGHPSATVVSHSGIIARNSKRCIFILYEEGNRWRRLYCHIVYILNLSRVWMWMWMWILMLMDESESDEFRRKGIASLLCTNSHSIISQTVRRNEFPAYIQGQRHAVLAQ